MWRIFTLSLEEELLSWNEFDESLKTIKEHARSPKAFFNHHIKLSIFKTSDQHTALLPPIHKSPKMGFTTYSGPASSFPPMSSWATFETIFNNNKTSMFATGDTSNDVGYIWNAVLEAAKVGVEERVIFCIVMQESTGNVGVQSTTAPDGSTSAGLMQCDGSPGFPGQHGLTQVRNLLSLFSFLWRRSWQME